MLILIWPHYVRQGARERDSQLLCLIKLSAATHCIRVLPDTEWDLDVDAAARKIPVGKARRIVNSDPDRRSIARSDHSLGDPLAHSRKA